MNISKSDPRRVSARVQQNFPVLPLLVEPTPTFTRLVPVCQTFPRQPVSEGWWS